jgi:hypothetical protein
MANSLQLMRGEEVVVVAVTRIEEFDAQQTR